MHSCISFCFQIYEAAPLVTLALLAAMLMHLEVNLHTKRLFQVNPQEDCQ